MTRSMSPHGCPHPRAQNDRIFLYKAAQIALEGPRDSTFAFVQSIFISSTRAPKQNVCIFMYILHSTHPAGGRVTLRAHPFGIVAFHCIFCTARTLEAA